MSEAEWRERPETRCFAILVAWFAETLPVPNHVMLDEILREIYGERGSSRELNVFAALQAYDAGERVVRAWATLPGKDREMLDEVTLPMREGEIQFVKAPKTVAFGIDGTALFEVEVDNEVVATLALPVTACDAADET